MRGRLPPDTKREPQYFFSDPAMETIAQKIADLKNRESSRGVSIQELFEDSFLLPAHLGDARRKSRGLQEILVSAYKEAWHDEEVKNFYGLGKNDAIREFHAEDDKGAVEDTHALLATSFGHEAIDLKLLRGLIRNVDHGGETQWNLRSHDMDEAGIPDGIRALLYLDLLANEARAHIRGWLKANQRLNPSLPPDYVSAEAAKNAYIVKLRSKTEPKRYSIAYLKGLEERLADMVKERAKNLYKDDAEEMMNLWRAVNYLISSKFTQGTVSEFRQSMYVALKDKDMQKARQLLKARMIRNSDAFTPAAQRTIGVTQEEIKAVQAERGNTRKMSAEEKAVYEERKKQLQNQEILQPIMPYIGKTLYDRTKDRLIFCLGTGKISRTRTKYDKKTRLYIEKSSDVPAMEVRYFPRPNSGASARAKKENGFIGPGEFLTRIQKGEYELLENVSLKKDDEEIDAKFFPKK